VTILEASPANIQRTWPIRW